MTEATSVARRGGHGEGQGGNKDDYGMAPPIARRTQSFNTGAPVSAPLSAVRRRYLLTGTPTTFITGDPGGVDRVPPAHLRQLDTAPKIDN